MLPGGIMGGSGQGGGAGGDVAVGGDAEADGGGPAGPLVELGELTTRRGIRRQPKGRPAVLTSLPPGQWSVPGLAELGMPVPTIYTWIYRGWVTARRAPASRCWIITADEQQIRELRERRARPPGYYTRARWNPPEQETGNVQGAQP